MASTLSQPMSKPLDEQSSKTQTRILGALVLFGVLLLWFYLRHQDLNNASIVSQQSPDIVFKDAAGQTIKLSSFKGKVVLLQFWASWCGACAEELPSVNQFVKKFPDDKFAFIPISVDEGGVADVEAFRKKVPFDFKVYYDNTNMAADSLGTYKLPESYLIGKDGKILKKIVGPQEWMKPKYEEMIRSVL